jgi:adenylate kinase
MDAGQLVSDEVVLGIIRERIRNPDTARGFVLDGFPRNLAQATALDNLLAAAEQPLDVAVLLNVDFDILMQRLTGRRTCGTCGRVYNVYTTPPKLEGRCDVCGGALRSRADDNEETIGNRLRVYETQTRPLIAYYQRKNRMVEVDGVGDIDAIFKRLVSVLEPYRIARPPRSSARAKPGVREAASAAPAGAGATVPSRSKRAVATPHVAPPAERAAKRLPEKAASEPAPAPEKRRSTSPRRPASAGTGAVRRAESGASRRPSRKAAAARPKKKKAHTRRARATTGGAAKRRARAAPARSKARKAAKKASRKTSGRTARARTRRKASRRR